MKFPILKSQSQFLFRGYESILPTSLPYIFLGTRDSTPWRPAAVIGTIGHVKNTESYFQVLLYSFENLRFKGIYLGSNPISTSYDFKVRKCKKKKRTNFRGHISIYEFQCVSNWYIHRFWRLLLPHPFKFYSWVDYDLTTSSGSNKPCPFYIRMKTFSTYVIGNVVWLLATTTKISSLHYF